jgi:DNA-binding transcriptional regulator YiaG
MSDIQHVKASDHEASSAKPMRSGPIEPAECRAGRAFLGWSPQELAARTGLSVRTIANFEGGQSIPLSAKVALRRAFKKGLRKKG